MFKIWERYDLKKYRWAILLLIILLCTAGIYVLDKVQGEDIDMVSKQIKGLIGGVILDLSGAKMLTLIATIFTAAGTAVLIATVDKVKK